MGAILSLEASVWQSKNAFHGLQVVGNLLFKESLLRWTHLKQSLPRMANAILNYPKAILRYQELLIFSACERKVYSPVGRPTTTTTTTRAQLWASTIIIPLGFSNLAPDKGYNLNQKEGGWNLKGLTIEGDSCPGKWWAQSLEWIPWPILGHTEPAAVGLLSPASDTSHVNLKLSGSKN